MSTKPKISESISKINTQQFNKFNKELTHKISKIEKNTQESIYKSLDSIANNKLNQFYDLIKKDTINSFNRMIDNNIEQSNEINQVNPHIFKDMLESILIPMATNNNITTNKSVFRSGTRKMMKLLLKQIEYNSNLI